MSNVTIGATFHSFGFRMFSSASLGRHLSLILLFIVFLWRHYVVSPSSAPTPVTSSGHKASVHCYPAAALDATTMMQDYAY